MSEAGSTVTMGSRRSGTRRLGERLTTRAIARHLREDEHALARPSDESLHRGRRRDAVTYSELRPRHATKKIKTVTTPSNVITFEREAAMSSPMSSASFARRSNRSRPAGSE